jgi:hypothetical protein
MNEAGVKKVYLVEDPVEPVYESLRATLELDQLGSILRDIL